jgi:glycosyltransferase involved in cell wall biosynthesis
VMEAPYSYKSLGTSNSRRRRRARQRRLDQVTLLVGLVEQGEPFEQDYLERYARLFNDGSVAEPMLFWGASESWWPWIRQFRRRLSSVDRVVVALAREEASLGRLAALVVLARFFGKPVALWYRNPCLETSLESGGRWLKYIVRLATMVVCPDRHAQQWLQYFGIRAHIVSDFVPGSKCETEPVSRLQPRILASGPISRRGDFGGLVKAFELVKGKYPRAELTIVGDGPLSGQISSWQSSCNGNSYSGYDSHNGLSAGIAVVMQPDSQALEQLVAGCDLYVCSATQTLRPIGLLRAMAAGRPVVSTDTGSVRTLIDKDRHGLLVPINQPAMLAEAIIRLIESPHETSRLASAARQRVAGFTLSHARATWTRAWESALGADQGQSRVTAERPVDAAAVAGRERATQTLPVG